MTLICLYRWFDSLLSCSTTLVQVHYAYSVHGDGKADIVNLLAPELFF